MAVLSLFENTSAGAAARRRGTDLGHLSRERRLAFYLGACRALGLDAAAQPLRFVRCTDGRLRIFDPSRPMQPLAPAETGSGTAARLERELAAGSAAVASGGGIAYEIDLGSGDLRVREVIGSSRAAAAAAAVAAAAPHARHRRRRVERR